MEIDELLRCLQTLLDDDRKRPLEKKILLAAHNRLALQTDEIERLTNLLMQCDHPECAGLSNPANGKEER
jgi:hypothetical protein